MIIRTKSWLEDRGFKFAIEKTELISLRRKCGNGLTSLGIQLNPRLKFWFQIRRAANKATKVMTNISAPI